MRNDYQQTLEIEPQIGIHCPTKEGLRAKLERERRKVRTEIEEAWKLDGQHKDAWRNRLGRLDLASPQAKDLVKKLRLEVEGYKAEFPYAFGWTDLNSAYLLKSELANISLALLLLECACSDFQIWFTE